MYLLNRCYCVTQRLLPNFWLVTCNDQCQWSLWPGALTRAGPSELPGESLVRNFPSKCNFFRAKVADFLNPKSFERYVVYFLLKRKFLTVINRAAA